MFLHLVNTCSVLLAHTHAKFFSVFVCVVGQNKKFCLTCWGVIFKNQTMIVKFVELILSCHINLFVPSSRLFELWVFSCTNAKEQRTIVLTIHFFTFENYSNARLQPPACIAKWWLRLLRMKKIRNSDPNKVGWGYSPFKQKWKYQQANKGEICGWNIEAYFS